MTSKLYDVFLSHASADKPTVEALAQALRQLGLKPFLDKWHLVPGEPWQEALEEALDQSCTCAVFVGPGGLGPWQNEEMRSALAERVSKPSFRVIPVLLPKAPDSREKPLPRFLKRLTWVDFRGGLDDSDAFDRLLAGILGIAPGPGEVARPPRVEARLAQIPKDLETVEAAREAFGGELTDQRLAQIQEERRDLEEISPIEVLGDGSIWVGGEVRSSFLITGSYNQVFVGVPTDSGWERLLGSYLLGVAQECSELPLGLIDTRFTMLADRRRGFPCQRSMWTSMW